MKYLQGATAVALVALVTGCASTGATFRSGVGDAMLEHPPWFAGARATGPDSTLGHLPLTWQRGATQEPMFEPWAGSGTPVAALVGEMNRYLDSLGVSKPIAPGAIPPGVPPDVQFGCEAHPGDDCEVDADTASGRGNVRMRLAVGRPSADWVAWTEARADSARVTGTLVIRLEVGHYYIRQRGLRGTKVVELGTGHEAQLPWLTSLEGPVSVVQLTGVVMAPGGRAVRIAAEGILARRTRLAVSAIGGQELITSDDVEQLRSARREDLPGEPLAWRVALDHLVATLTGASAPRTVSVQRTR